MPTVAMIAAPTEKEAALGEVLAVILTFLPMHVLPTKVTN